MQRGTKQSEEARKAISAKMRKRWEKIPYAKRSAMAKKAAAKRAANSKSV